MQPPKMVKPRKLRVAQRSEPEETPPQREHGNRSPYIAPTASYININDYAQSFTFQNFTLHTLSGQSPYSRAAPFASIPLTWHANRA